MGIGKRIQELCKKRGLSIRKLSIMANVPYSTLYSIIKRDSDGVDSETISRIAKALNVPVMDIWIEIDEMCNYETERVAYELASISRKRAIKTDEFQRLYEEFEEKSKKYGIPPEAEKYVRILRQLGYLPNKDTEVNTQNVIPKLLQAIEKLNDDGKIIAVQRIEELTEIPSYQAKSDAKAADTAPEGKDTPEE